MDMLVTLFLFCLIALALIDYRLKRLVDNQEANHKELLAHLKNIQNALEK